MRRELRLLTLSKLSLLGIFIFLTGSSLIAQPAFNWALGTGYNNGSGGNQNDVGLELAVDHAGNSILAGTFRQTVDLDPGPGTNLQTSNGSDDIFIQKISPAGNLIWALTLGGTGNEDPQGIVVDSAGYIYLLGTFAGTVDFNPGTGVFNLSQNTNFDNFLLKLSPSGSFVWAKQFGSTSQNDGAFGLAIDQLGHLYTTGYIIGTVDLDPGPGIANVTANGSDLFVQKLDGNGDYIWGVNAGGSQSEGAYGITTDPQGNVLITGYFRSVADFDPGPGTYNLTSNGDLDAYILKLNSNGGFVWARSMGGNVDGDQGFSIATDQQGNVYTTGLFEGTVDFNPGGGTANLTSNGGWDCFIQKLNSSGNFQWAHNFGGTTNDYGNTVATDNQGNIYLTTLFYQTVDFQPGSGTLNLVSNSGHRTALQKFNPNGGLIWAERMAGDPDLFNKSMLVDPNGNIHLTGRFLSTPDFDPGSGVFNMSSQGGYDAFLTKLGQTGFCQPTTSTIAPTTCGSYTAPDGQVYTSSGTQTATIQNAAGCDSVITINLTVNQPSTSTIAPTTCGSYTAPDGQVYTSSGTQTATIPECRRM